MSCIFGVEQRCEDCRMCIKKSNTKKLTIESAAMEIRKVLNLKTPVTDLTKIQRLLDPPNNKQEERIRNQVLLAVLMPKTEFDHVCSQHMYKGLLYAHIDYDRVAEYFSVTRGDVIDRYRDLYPNYLL